MPAPSPSASCSPQVSRSSESALTRRQLVRGFAALLVPAAVASKATGARRLMASGRAAVSQADGGRPYDSATLPPGIRSRFVRNVNGITMHVLEAGFDAGDRPGVLLLHGFPELAFSWRKVMPPLASAGYHVFAPDLRGYGRTDGTDVTYDDDLGPYLLANRVADMVALVSGFGYRSVDVVGHDFGSPVAAWCAVVRPDIFRSVVLMSAPFGGTPSVPFDTAQAPPGVSPSAPTRGAIQAELAAVDPPRKHYQWYYSTREADENMWHAPQGVHAFLRAYYHMKSGDWETNRPYRLNAWTGRELAKMPHYYIMERDKGMAETVAVEMPSAAEISACEWLPDDEFRVYSTEYRRTGFQGGLNSYRVGTTGLNTDFQRAFAGRTIDQPSLFIAGKRDWGVYQRPGAVEAMERSACTDMRGVHLLDGAGHWVQQEQAAEVSRLLVEFLQDRGGIH